MQPQRTMESFFSRFKNALVLIAILLVQTIALATQINRAADLQRPDGKHVRLVRLWAQALVTPFERAATASGHAVRSGWSNYIALRGVRKQNQQLQQQVAALRLERAALAEDALEGQRLAKILSFKQQYIASTVVAEIVGTSGSDQSQMVTLDKGWRDGLKPGMAVITPDGVVGKLRDVFPTTAELLLLNDTTAGAGVMMQSTRIRGIVHGSRTGRLVITNLTPDQRIQPGEPVLTSGGDQVFPRGLPVGQIESIAPDPEHQPYTLITLKPAANLSRLEEVLIITSTGQGLPPQSEQELQADVQAHAADVRAERLPSLHEAAPAPDAGTAAAPPPENSTDLVPKPKPVLHPDRYSSGTAPPAAELTPGAPKPQEPK